MGDLVIFQTCSLIKCFRALVAFVKVCFTAQGRQRHIAPEPIFSRDA